MVVVGVRVGLIDLFVELRERLFICYCLIVLLTWVLLGDLWCFVFILVCLVSCLIVSV